MLLRHVKEMRHPPGQRISRNQDFAYKRLKPMQALAAMDRRFDDTFDRLITKWLVSVSSYALDQKNLSQAYTSRFSLRV
jgi:hypothetical protein